LHEIGLHELNLCPTTTKIIHVISYKIAIEQELTYNLVLEINKIIPIFLIE